MSHVPVHRIKKDELIWMGKHFCKHGHTYLEHYSCFIKDRPDMQKKGFLDIETSNLNADFGVILCYVIKEAGKDGKIYKKAVTKKEVLHATQPDFAVLESLVKDLGRFDILYTYFGTGFDLPYIRTRAVSLGIDFPSHGEIKHKDIYYVIRNKFKLHRNRLETACQELLGGTRKSHYDGNMWRRALQGDQESIGYILDHCVSDVLDLEDLTNKVLNFAYPQEKSI